MASSRVAHLVGQSVGANIHLPARITEGFARHGILNPHAVANAGLRLRLFLVSSRPGYMKELVATSGEHRSGVSQFILYGEWDTLLMMNGTDSESEAMHHALVTSAVDAPHYTAGSYIYFRRQRVDPAEDVAVSQEERQIVERLVDDYDATGTEQQRDGLLARKVLLGSTWRRNGQSPYPVQAFIGLNVRSRQNLPPANLLDILLGESSISDCLSDLILLDHGRPFHYLARVECTDLEELDELTTDIGSLSAVGVPIDGLTLIVANGHSDLGSLREPSAPLSVNLGPDLSRLIDVAQQALLELPQSARDTFDELAEVHQLAIVRGVIELRTSLTESSLSDGTRSRFRAAISTFVRECASATGTPNLTGSVAEAATTAEGLARRALSKFSYSVLGKDQQAHQDVLRLPTRKIGQLSLGRIAMAFDEAVKSGRFETHGELLAEENRDRIRLLAEQRNFWLHDVVEGTSVDLIDNARRFILDAIRVSEWSEGCVNQIEGDTEQPTALDLESDKPEERRIFLSHATVDGAISDRIASGLKLFDLDSFYAEWDLAPGDSIVERINQSLAKTDILIVLLSPNAVASSWVQRELSAGIAAQLSGRGVRVLPVVIEPCDIPPLLADILYLDLSTEFEAGLLKLIELLLEWRAVK